MQPSTEAAKLPLTPDPGADPATPATTPATSAAATPAVAGAAAVAPDGMIAAFSVVPEEPPPTP